MRSFFLLIALASAVVSGIHLQGQSQNSFLHKGADGCPDIQWVQTPEPVPYTVKWCYSGAHCVSDDDYIWVTVVTSHAYIQCRPEPIKLILDIFSWVMTAVMILIAPALEGVSIIEETMAYSMDVLTDTLQEGFKTAAEIGQNVGKDCYCFAERWTQVDQIFTVITTDAGNTATVEVPKEYLSNVNSERVRQNTLLRIRTDSCNNQGWKDRVCSNTYLRTLTTLSWSDLMDEIAWLGDRGMQPRSFVLWKGETIRNAPCGTQPGLKQASLARQWCFSTSCITSDDHIDVYYNGWAEIKCENPFSLTIPSVGELIMSAYRLQTDWRQSGGCLCYPTNYDNTPFVAWVHDASGDQANIHIPPSEFGALDENQIEFGTFMATENCTSGNWQSNICSRFAGAQTKYEYDWDEYGDDISWWGDRNVDVDGLWKKATVDLTYAPTKPIASVCTSSLPCLKDLSPLSPSNLGLNDAYEIVSAFSGNCIEMPGASMSTSTPTDTWDCATHALWERFRIIPSIAGSSYRLQFVHSGLCLENTMLMATCTTDDANTKQLWTISQAGVNKELWKIASAQNPNQVLSLSQISFNNGNRLKVSSPMIMSKNIKNNLHFSQVWYIRRNNAPNPNANLCLNEKGQDVCVSDNSVFKLDPYQFYDIVNMVTGSCIQQFTGNRDVGNYFRPDSCLAFGQNPGNAMYQFYKFIPTNFTNVFSIQVQHDNLCLEIAEFTGGIFQSPCSSLQTKQFFTFANIGNPKEVWVIKPYSFFSTSVLNLNTDKYAENLNTATYEPRLLGLKNQRWYIRRRSTTLPWNAALCLSSYGQNLCSQNPSDQTTNDLYYIISADTNRCLTLTGKSGGEKLGTSACQPGTPTQLFKFQKSSWLGIQSVNSGMCLQLQPLETIPNQVPCYSVYNTIQNWALLPWSSYGVSPLLMTINNQATGKDLVTISNMPDSLSVSAPTTPQGVNPISHLFYFRKDLPDECDGPWQCARDIEATVTNYITYVLINAESRKCLEALPEPEAPTYPLKIGVQEMPCTGALNQQWEFHRWVSSGVYELMNQMSKLCLTRNSDKITIATTNCYYDQTHSMKNSWNFINPTKSYYWSLQQVDTGLTLDKNANGYVLNPANGSRSQSYMFRKV